MQTGLAIGYPLHRWRSCLLAAAAAALLFVMAGMPAAAARTYAAIVIDADSGEVLSSEKADTKAYPASLTKMMTLYLTFDALDAGRIRLDTQMRVSARAAAQPPTKLGLRAGTSIKVEDAILGLVTKSANDAAMVLAEALGGNQAAFAARMTRKARDLGMTRTVFRNPHGLPDPAQVTTARDMARLGRALIRDHARHYHYFSRSAFTYRGVRHNNHNRLMTRYMGMDGLKTGYTRASGFNLAASAVRDGRRLIAVVLGGQTAGWRDNRMEGLLDAAFRKAGPASRPTRDLRMAALTAQAAPLPNRKPAGNGPLAAVAALTEPEADAAALNAGGIGQLAQRLADGAREFSPISTAEAAVMPAPLPPSRSGGSWSIQIGAFSDDDASRRALGLAVGRMPDLLGGATPQSVAVRSSGRTLYRARLGGLDEETARSVCTRMERSGQDCMPLPPERS
jgi:D-alanyl-D-alanine carboxypeptidase